jgi:GDP-4-dehydro-6-deoxy-D-mannose reductase
VVIARSFNHIGPGQDERFVIPSIARQLAKILLNEEEAVLHAGNLAVDRDFLDVRDAVRAYVTVMKDGENRQAYNICSGEARSIAGVVQRLVELSDTGARLALDPGRLRAIDIPALHGDASRLKALGWRQRLTLDETLRELLLEAVNHA